MDKAREGGLPDLAIAPVEMDINSEADVARVMRGCDCALWGD